MKENRNGWQSFKHDLYKASIWAAILYLVGTTFWDCATSRHKIIRYPANWLLGFVIVFVGALFISALVIGGMLHGLFSEETTGQLIWILSAVAGVIDGFG